MACKMCRARPQAIILLTLNVILCQCKCPQITFKNAVSVKGCSTSCTDQLVRGCIEPDSFIEDAERINIYNTKIEVFRRGAIQNMALLRKISLLNLHIKKLYPGCFLNLPSIKIIELNYNEIQEILWGVFSNSTIEDLNFSWNEIETIEDEAFSDMPNLKTLNLIRNQLKTFQKNWFTNSPSLETLILAYNQIEDIGQGAFDGFPNLTFVDLSFNKISELGGDLFSSLAHLDRLDLTSNQLLAIEPTVFLNGPHVEHLIVSLNKLSFLPAKLLNNGFVRKLRLHPNPWKCPCLDDILRWISANNAISESYYEDHRLVFRDNYPQCIVSSNNTEKCVINYGQGLADDQNDFFQAVNYSEVIREKPTSKKPNFDVIHTATPPSG